MTIAITTVTVCSGQNHVTISGTVNGVARTIRLAADRFQAASDPEDQVEAFINRCRSAVLESGATTMAQRKAALEGKTFQI